MLYVMYFTAKEGQGDKSKLNDGSFDGFLKQVERMHTEDKYSFEDEFYVRKLGTFQSSPSARTHINLLTITIGHAYTNTHACTHHTYTHTQSIDKKTASTTVVGELNNPKNRYKNIFPCECLVSVIVK